jgi:6-pyruvoyltetrahydropterin/6-carboxytetrahydropterin synthase
MVEAVFAAEETPGSGMVVDFSDAARVLERAIEPFDHTYLNEVEPFDDLPPTAENVAKTVFAQLESIAASESLQVGLMSVTVWESPEAWASYTP